MPVYDEEKTLAEMIKRVQRVSLGKIFKEIIIVDDFSKDNTFKIAEELEGNYKNIRVFRHTKNQGKGAAVRTGIKHALGDIAVIQDGDLEYNPQDFKKLIEPIIRGESEAVYGSRFMNPQHANLVLFGKNKTPLPSHYLGNKFLSFMTGLLYGKTVTDMETCYKMVSLPLLKSLNLKANKFEIEPEITAKLLRDNKKIVELPINYSSRSVAEGKKIKWKDGITALTTLLRYRFFK